MTLWRISILSFGIGMLAASARAADYEALWTNPDPTRTALLVRLCGADACVTPVATTCAPQETCRTMFPTAPLSRAVFIASSADGASWSAQSNTIQVDDCLRSTACRSDYDRNGTVTVADFAVFLTVFGRASR